MPVPPYQFLQVPRGVARGAFRCLLEPLGACSCCRLCILVPPSAFSRCLSVSPGVTRCCPVPPDTVWCFSVLMLSPDASLYRPEPQNTACCRSLCSTIIEKDLDKTATAFWAPSTLPQCVYLFRRIPLILKSTVSANLSNMPNVSCTI